MHENKNVPVFFIPHALDSARKRGTNQIEIQLAIKSGTWRPAKHNRIETEMEFAYNKDWNNVFYKFKKVAPVFIIEDERIIVITVYCFYY